jgi:hypothetical protein
MPTGPPTFSSLLPPADLPSIIPPAPPAPTDPAKLLARLEGSVDELTANVFFARRAAAKADACLGGGFVSAGYVDGLDWEREAEQAKAEAARLTARITALEAEHKAEKEGFRRDIEALKNEIGLADDQRGEIEKLKSQLAEMARANESLRAQTGIERKTDDAIRMSPALLKRMSKQGWTVPVPSPADAIAVALPSCSPKPAAKTSPLKNGTPQTSPPDARPAAPAPTDLREVRAPYHEVQR